MRVRTSLDLAEEVGFLEVAKNQEKVGAWPIGVLFQAQSWHRRQHSGNSGRKTNAMRHADVGYEKKQEQRCWQGEVVQNLQGEDKNPKFDLGGNWRGWWDR